MAERIITIQEKEVAMRYCAATETGFEQIRGNTVDVFIPRQENGEVIPPTATTQDYVALAYAAIIAAYARKGTDAPVDFDTILYECNPTEIMLLMRTVMELRNEWYQLPSAIKPETTKTEDEEKN